MYKYLFMILLACAAAHAMTLGQLNPPTSKWVMGMTASPSCDTCQWGLYVDAKGMLQSIAVHFDFTVQDLKNCNIDEIRSTGLTGDPNSPSYYYTDFIFLPEAKADHDKKSGLCMLIDNKLYYDMEDGFDANKYYPINLQKNTRQGYLTSNNSCQSCTFTDTKNNITYKINLY